uniref:Retrotransposon gag domain-containing protein n=1 Tax=Phytophthora ramorum TaxID=164328 RepID=H3GRG8_PHYRM
MPEISEAAAVSAGRSGGVRSLARNLTEELNEVAGPEPANGYDEDGSDDQQSSAMAEDANSRPNGGRPPLNGDTPAANRVLGRYLELMKRVVRQVIWMELGGELTVPVESWSTRQVAEDTVQLLRAMGCEPQLFPSEADLRAWAPEDAATALRKWKHKLRSAFGVAEAGVSRPPNVRHASDPVDPSMIPLPLTPGRRPRESTEAGIFSARGATSTRTPSRRYDLRDDSSDEDSFDVGDTGGDLTGEWARQIRELSSVENDSATPRLEIATHLPLGNIKPYLGLRDKSEKSMQWLRAFIYEMKGTNTPPNEWCMAFELSLQDGALHWYRQLPRKTRRTWKLLSDAFIKYYCSRFNQSAKTRYYSAKREEKEHVCDYLNRLNGYARNAGVQFEHGGRDAKDHVEHFLDSRHREDDRRQEDRYRDENRRRDDQQYRPRVTLTDALTDIVTAQNAGRPTDTRGGYPEVYNGGYDDTEEYGLESHSDDDDRYSEGYSDDGYATTEDRGHVAAANGTERRNAAEGTFARADNRRPRASNGQWPYDRDDPRRNSPGRDGRRQYGPCAACGGLTHSAHYCFKRCKMCKQVHDAGKCEAFQELTNLLRAKVEKKDLSPELQELVYGSHLN